jgi:hypothetical protein
LSVVKLRSLRRADHSSRGVPPTVARRVWSRSLVNEEAIAFAGLQSHNNNNNNHHHHLIPDTIFEKM